MNENDAKEQQSVDERRLTLEARRVELEGSFARKWLPTIATIMVAFVATVFGYVQQKNASEATERARIEARAKDEREWGFKVVEMYFAKRDMFDLTKNSVQATANLRVLAAVAPTAVQGLLNAEKARIPAPSSETGENQRLDSLAAVAEIQSAISGKSDPAKSSSTQASSYLVYVQYAEGSRDMAVKAQVALQQFGFRAPGIEQVKKAPSRLQVRYYRSDQKEFAGTLATNLGRSLGVATTADNAVLVTSQRQLPSGILELWLPST